MSKKTFKKILRSGWNNFQRQGILTFATLFIIFIAVFLASSLYLFGGAIYFLNDRLQERIDISVFFKENTAREDIAGIEEQLKAVPEVKKVEYISADEAYQKFVEEHKDDQYYEALQAIEMNPFLASVHVQAKDPSQYGEISSFLKKDEFQSVIQNVNDYKRGTVIQKLTDLTKNIRTIGFALIGFLSLIAVLVTFNTIKLTIFSQKAEIEIMRLVGAKKSFIQGPYFIQGLLCGLSASLFAFVLFGAFAFILQDKLSGIFLGFNMFDFYRTNLWQLLALQFGTGLLLGTISSVLAVQAYLKK
ncbi:MAG: permease-like cell division protein FtsX [Candidatus Paceibacterota bacterium]|jgi:cell division transport system permease protein|nr:permease-like cell division protein FtsX [Candidatus Paceibacterota bacterium]MDD4831077.1 permease-like cell division protein FtsX [Candidatus Paceibacterota bacterium]MDD4875039.1 permease-like cell division protein FtsX [Candidatus Paceibacterota bacterium]